MKLIHCPHCYDLVALHREKRFCECRKCWGYYVNTVDAEISKDAIPIGIANSSMIRAIDNRPDSGWGETFEAFVIPRECASIKYSKDS